MNNFQFKVDRSSTPCILYDEELFFDDVEAEYLPPNRVYRKWRWVTAADGSRSYQNNGGVYGTVSMDKYLQLHKMYFMLLGEALLPESFGPDDESQTCGRNFIKEMKRNNEFAKYCGSLFNAWYEKKIVGKEAKNGPIVKNALCRAVLESVLKEGVSEQELGKEYVPNCSLDFTLEALRNKRGPTGEATSKRICLVVLNHEKVREVGEEQLKLYMKNKTYDKKCQFFNAVIRCRGNLYHKALTRYFKEMETVDAAIRTGESMDTGSKGTIVRSSHYPHRPAEEQDIVVGVTRVSKNFGTHGWFDGRIRKYRAKDQLYNIVYEDGDAEDLTLEELLPLVVVNFMDYYALPAGENNDAFSASAGNNIENEMNSEGSDTENEQNLDEEEYSVASSDDLNSVEDKCVEKFIRRGYLKWHVPREKYINTKGTENKVMKQACLLGAGSTIPPDVDGFGNSVMARCPKESVRLLVEMALSNKSIAGCLHAIGRVQINEEWVDVLGVGLLVDAFPRTNDVSGVMWQLTPQFIPEFCNHPSWIIRLFGMDGSESSSLCHKYFSEQLCPFFLDCVEKPQEHVFEVLVGYHSARGWPPIEKEKGSFKTKKFCIQPTVSSDGAGASKTFGHSGGSCDWPSPVVKGLKRTEINNPDIMVFDAAQYLRDGPFIKKNKGVLEEDSF